MESTKKVIDKIFTVKCPASNNACPSVTSAVGSRKALYPIEQGKTLVISMIWSTVYASLVFLGEEQRKMLPSLLPICFLFLWWYFSTPVFFWWLWQGTSCLRHNGSMFQHLLALCTWWHLGASLLASHACHGGVRFYSYDSGVKWSRNVRGS